MKISKAARVAALMAGAAALLTTTPALAQRAGDRPQPQPQVQTQPQAQPGAQQPAPQRTYALSRAEQAAINPLLQANAAANAAGQAADWAAVEALLPAAQAAAQSNDAKYLVARVQLSVAIGKNDIAAQERAIATLIASPSTLPPEAATYREVQSNILNRRAEAAFSANDFATAERIYQQLLQANPGDQRLINNIAIVRGRMGNTEGALEPVLTQIRAAEAAGQRAGEPLYRRARDTFYTQRDGARAMEFAVLLARHYPTAPNWRDAIQMTREFGDPSPALTLDLFRLARAANALQGEEDYLTFAQLLDQAGLPGETKAVVEEGIARGAYPATRQGVREMLAKANQGIAEDRTGLERQVQEARAGSTANLARVVGDALYGYGRFAEAADMYRLAMTRSGADRDLLNLRLGAALVAANQRGEAETAFRAVGGQAAGPARLWLAWLGRNQG